MHLALRRARYFSGLLLVLFLGAHLINTWLAALGEDVYDRAQSALRAVYQWPAIELTLGVALVTHVICAVKCAPASSGHPVSTLRRVSQWILLALVVAHVSAVRVPSLAWGIHPEFAGIAFTLEAAPLLFFPYYLCFVSLAVYHVASARMRPAPAWITTAVAAAFTLAALLGFSGYFAPPVDLEGHPYAELVRPWIP